MKSPILKIRSYKSCLVFDWDWDYIEKRMTTNQLKDDDMQLPSGNHIGTFLMNTHKNLGISVEALQMIESLKDTKSHDDVVSVDFTSKDLVGFIGWPRNTIMHISKFRNSSYGYVKPDHVQIDNTVSDEVKKIIDETF